MNASPSSPVKTTSGRQACSSATGSTPLRLPTSRGQLAPIERSSPPPTTRARRASSPEQPGSSVTSSSATDTTASPIEIVNAFNTEYVTPNGRVVSDSPTAYALALRFDLLPPDQHDRAADRLVELIRRDGYRIGTASWARR
jgi:Bacterial alpha-L-rhamnosidase 6 hairpin glycosidase domain